MHWEWEQTKLWIFLRYNSCWKCWKSFTPRRYTTCIKQRFLVLPIFARIYCTRTYMKRDTLAVPEAHLLHLFSFFLISSFEKKITIRKIVRKRSDVAFKGTSVEEMPSLQIWLLWHFPFISFPLHFFLFFY